VLPGEAISPTGEDIDAEPQAEHLLAGVPVGTAEFVAGLSGILSFLS
jgi:hypothetical protein